MTELRKIDVSGFDQLPVSRPPSDLPALDWVAIADLRIDDRYQRPLGRRNRESIGKIADTFSWQRFTPCLVAPVEDGLFCLIDGQHRTHAALLAGYDQVPAMSVPMTPQEQAKAFSDVNGQVTAITIFNIYKAALAAEEPWALASDRAVTAAGCRLRQSNSSAMAKKPRDLYCIGVVRSYVRQDKAGLVTAALWSLANCHQGDQRALYEAWFLKPWFSMVAHANRPNRDKLLAFLDDLDPVRFYRGVDRKRENSPDSGMSFHAMLTDELTRAYEKWAIAK